MKKKFLSVICSVLVLVTVFSSLSIVTSAATVTNLKTPNVKKITAYNTGVKIVWDSFTEHPYYSFLIYRSSTGKKGTWTKIALTDAGETSYTDKNVTLGKTYVYTVKSYYRDEYNSLTHISEMSGKHKVTVSLASPDFTLVGNGGRGILLKWKNRNDVTGFIIYKSLEGKAGTWSKIATIKNNRVGEFTDSSVKIGETYYYCIKAYKTLNGKNYYSKSSKAYKRVILDVKVPENLKASVVDDGVKITYNKVPGTAGYIIYRSTTGKAGTWSRINVTTSNNTIKFIDKTAEYGKTYYYTVKSYKTVSGETVYSKPAKSVKVGPKIEFASEDIIFDDFYEEIGFDLLVEGFRDDDYLRIFVNGVELTEELVEDEKAFADFMGDLNFFFEIDERLSTENTISFKVYRVAPGNGTLRVQHSQNPDLYDELKIECPELDFDKEYSAVVNLLGEAYDDIAKAKELLMVDYEENKSKYVEYHKNCPAAKKLVMSANRKYADALEILSKYNDDYKNYELYRDDVDLVDDLLKITEYELIAMESNSETDNTLQMAVEYLDRILNRYES